MIIKNAVIGLAINYDIDHVSTFIKSFRKFNQTDDVILFVNADRTEHLNSFLKEYNIKTVTYETHHIADTRMNNARFLKYLEFLSDVEYQNIFISDVRDLIFQGNPFDNLPTKFLYVFEEDRGIRLGKCEYNSYWMLCAYGKDILEKLFWNPIICAGTILGSQTEIIKLLKIIKQELLNIKHRDYSNYRDVNIDQAILNYIVYDSHNLKLEIKRNGDIVATIGQSVTQASANDTVTHNNNHLFLNGVLPYVVHQYDRHQKLSEFFSQIYNPA